MKSPRFKAVIFKFKSYQQKRSLNLFCSSDTIRSSAYISSSRSPNMLIRFFIGKLRRIPTTSMKTTCSNFDVRNDVSSRQQVNSYLPSQQLTTKSIINYQMNSSFQPIKGGIFHTLRHLGFQIKILLLLSFFLFL